MSAEVRCYYREIKGPALGTPLPSVPHAVSVAMPSWQDIIDYEEGSEDVHAALQTGYPRYVIHSEVERLVRELESSYGRRGERALPFPSRESAQACVAFARGRGEGRGRVVRWNDSAVHAVFLPSEKIGLAREYWQCTGRIVSSRQAQSLLQGGFATTENVEYHLRARLASLYDASVEDIRLHPSGMAALFYAHQVIGEVFSEKGIIQFGSCFADTRRIQNYFSGAVYSFVGVTEADYVMVEELCATGTIAALFCEFPTNPLLQCVDLHRLRSITEHYSVVLVVDDTLSTPLLAEVKSFADIVVTSLTKFISGSGDVMAGSSLLTQRSVRFPQLVKRLHAYPSDPLWIDDAAQLLSNAADVEQRVKAMSYTTRCVVEFLSAHPRIAKVFHPLVDSISSFEKVRIDPFGVPPLCSFVLESPACTTAPFFDRLNLPKGPSLGTNFTLVCPYAMLAHYNELNEVSRIGISPYLLRLSVGLEEPAKILNALEIALDAV